MFNITFTNKHTIGIYLLVIGLFLVPVFIKSADTIHLIISILLHCALSCALLLTWRLGFISLVQAGIMGVGAYTAVVLTKSYNMNIWLSFATGTLTATFFGFILGSILLRLRGAYFICCTFAANELLCSVWRYFRDPFGGALGIIGIPKPSFEILGLLSISFFSSGSFYYLFLIFAVGTIFLVNRLLNSHFGYKTTAIENSLELAESIGIPTVRHKVIVFTITSFFTGLGGVLLAFYTGVINPSMFGIPVSMDIFVYCIVGGTSTVLGPILGALSLTAIAHFLFEIGAWKDIAIGVLLIIIVLVMPGGIESIIPGKRKTLKNPIARVLSQLLSKKNHVEPEKLKSIIEMGG